MRCGRLLLLWAKLLSTGTVDSHLHAGSDDLINHVSAREVLSLALLTVDNQAGHLFFCTCQRTVPLWCGDRFVKMPPFLPRKHLLSPEPRPLETATPKAKGKLVPKKPTPRKATLFDDLDATPGSSRGAKAILEKFGGDEGDSSSELSSLDEEFEDGPVAKRRKTTIRHDDDDDEDEDVEFEDVPHVKRYDDADISEDDDEDMEFEDVDVQMNPPSALQPTSAISGQSSVGTADLELTLRKETRVSLTNPLGLKKGPTKIERGIRLATHQMHVQMLMWHNAVRNSWLCDGELQSILVDGLPKGVAKEVDIWRKRSGVVGKGKMSAPAKKGKEKAIAVKSKTKGKDPEKKNSRNQTDWSAAKRLEDATSSTSGSDPLLRLLKALRIYWRSRFRITAPGLRKVGYMSLERIDEELKSFKDDVHDPERHGEHIASLEEFMQHARSMEGSRDVGAQLFTALLRGLGIEARMVANLQPLGFGWSQFEEAFDKNPRKLKKQQQIKPSVDNDSSDEEDDEEEGPVGNKGKAAVKSKVNAKSPLQNAGKRKSQGSGVKDEPIDLSASEGNDSSSDESVIDVTPAKQTVKPSLPYDKDLLFPYYWTEALSPVTSTYTPVDAVVLHVVAKDPKRLEKFEPRGGKSDKAKQVTSYIIGHSSDGTAKDVTTRYLKKHIWPGRTKGYRLPIEKVPVYGRNGKVKRYEYSDWFKSVMRGYSRGHKNYPYTEIDDHEDATDLKPVKPEKKIIEEGKETLQSYKASTEFVLERHFKREEALRAGAKPVKTFTIKGKGVESVDENVYLRKDVVSCKSTETWHKEGRAPILGEEPLKRVPYRVATTNRRRELAEAEHASGEKPLQGLFSREQTDWIIPPPIENGVIPKNNFGNIDLYVDSMLPEGAAHVPRRGTVKICKRLGIDYAEAVTGFEFGHRMAVPIITGVVIAEDHYDTVMDQWEKDEVERLRKEDEKRTKAALGMWRKMLMGMRIIEKVREEYGDELDDKPDEVNPWTSKKDRNAEEEARRRIMAERDEEMAGGFLPEGYHVEEDERRKPGFFPVAKHDDDDGGGFVVEEHDEHSTTSHSNGKVAIAHPTMNEEEPADAGIDADDLQKASPVSSILPVEDRPPRGLTKGSKVKTPAKTPLRTTTKKETPATKGKRKQKLSVQDSYDEADDDESSDIEESEAEIMPKKSTRKSSTRATVQKTATPPGRRSARTSGVKSKYFVRDSDDEEDD